MVKKEKVKLTFFDHIFYFFMYIFLFLSGFLYVIILPLQKKILLGKAVLAVGETPALLWLIPTMLVAGVGLIAANELERKKVKAAAFFREITQSIKRRVLLIAMLSIYVVSFVAALWGSTITLTNSQIVETHVFGIVKNEYAIEYDQIQSADVTIYKKIFSTGRGGSQIYVCSYKLKMKNGKNFRFEYYATEDIPTIQTIIHPVEKSYHGLENLDDWLRSLDCDDLLKEEIESAFPQNVK